MYSAVGVSAASAVASSAAASGAGGAAAGAGSSGSAAMMNPTTFWSLIEVLQIINYMIYIAAESPYLLSQLFRSLSIANGDFMPDVFGYFLSGSGIDPPGRFSDEGLSSNFFLNAG